MESQASTGPAQAFEQLDSYTDAKVGTDAEYSSLCVHSQYYRRSRETNLVLTWEEQQRALAIAETAYRAAKYDLPADFLSKDHFLRVVRDLDFTSSPGIPYCYEAATIKDFLGWDGLDFNYYSLERLWYDVQRFIAGDAEVLYRVFVKDEPHKIQKALQERWRLIICPPLFEQVVWAMCFGPGNDREIETCGQTPSYQGMKLCAGHWKRHVDAFNQSGLDAGQDKTAWDWTAHIELIRLELELRERLITSEPGQVQRWRTLAERCYQGAFEHPRLVLSDGRVFEQLEPGIMKSGCVNTISTNSHCQVLLHILAACRSGITPYPLPVAVGDDTLVNSRTSPSIAALAQFGAIVKDLTVSRSFVGHLFPLTTRGQGPVPEYNVKHLYRFLQIEELDVEDFLESMRRLYIHADEWFALWSTVLRRRCYRSPWSYHYLKYWYDYEDVGAWADQWNDWLGHH